MKNIQNCEKYFAYGSNMLTCRLEERVGGVEVSGIGTLNNYKLVFNKLGKKGSGKANIVESSKSSVGGVVFCLSKSQLKKLDKFEGEGYERKATPIVFKGKQIRAYVYFAKNEYTKNDLKPTADYLDLIICGAKEHKLNKQYIEFLRSQNL